MNVHGKPTRTIWAVDDGVEIIDQTALPHAFVIRKLTALSDAVRAITTMEVRGAPLIGATAAYGMWLAVHADPSDRGVAAAREALLATRPTAVNLRWALEAVAVRLAPLPPEARAGAARAAADEIAEDDVAINRGIGEHALAVFRATRRRRRGGPLQILTHCNAGWLATVDHGTALAGVYAAHDAGLGVHVWVDETRPRNQGAALTAWELAQHGVPHTVIVDNAGGHLMQRGMVDLVIVGTDRTTAAGDVVNKIGTYLKALAARDNAIPFYVAAPSPSIDWSIVGAPEVIPIEERDGEEVATVSGATPAGEVTRVRIAAPGSPVSNPGFDVTPARLVTAIVTERGVAPATAEGLALLFPERTGTAPASGGQERL